MWEPLCLWRFNGDTWGEVVLGNLWLLLCLHVGTGIDMGLLRFCDRKGQGSVVFASRGADLRRTSLCSVARISDCQSCRGTAGTGLISVMSLLRSLRFPGWA